MLPSISHLLNVAPPSPPMSTAPVFSVTPPSPAASQPPSPPTLLTGGKHDGLMYSQKRRLSISPLLSPSDAFPSPRSSHSRSHSWQPSIERGQDHFAKVSSPSSFLTDDKDLLPPLQGYDPPRSPARSPQPQAARVNHIAPWSDALSLDSRQPEKRRRLDHYSPPQPRTAAPTSAHPSVQHHVKPAAPSMPSFVSSSVSPSVSPSASSSVPSTKPSFVSPTKPSAKPSPSDRASSAAPTLVSIPPRQVDMPPPATQILVSSTGQTILKRRRGRPPSMREPTWEGGWTFLTPTVWDVKSQNTSQNDRDAVPATEQDSTMDGSLAAFTSADMDTVLQMPRKKRGRKPKTHITGNSCFMWKELTSTRTSKKQPQSQQQQQHASTPPVQA